jgi:hypothetical protein
MQLDPRRLIGHFQSAAPDSNIFNQPAASVDVVDIWVDTVKQSKYGIGDVAVASGTACSEDGRAGKPPFSPGQGKSKSLFLSIGSMTVMRKPAAIPGLHSTYCRGRACGCRRCFGVEPPC